MKNVNIMIVGVGGQGTLLASRVIGNVVIKEGYDVKLSEVHGMSQRGGNVVTYVKYGEKINSPLIEKGEADIILAFEALEALRWIEFLKPEGILIVNEQEINPMPVIMGRAKYPDNIISKMSQNVKSVMSLNAFDIANECGNSKAVNVVLIGLLASISDIPQECWLEAIKEVVPAKVLDVNLKAFKAGYERGQR
jgi:indolepyruvate ferredoxin oxidoreductase beta subunit